MAPKKKVSEVAGPSASLPPQPEPAVGGGDAVGEVAAGEDTRGATKSKNRADDRASASEDASRLSRQTTTQQRHATGGGIRLLDQGQTGGSRDAPDHRSGTSKVKTPGGTLLLLTLLGVRAYPAPRATRPRAPRTPTGAPGPGPHTVPSVVGPGPNSARARVAWVALLLNSAPVAPSPGGARLSRRRGGEACEVCVTWVACAGLNRAGTRHVVHNFF